MAKQSRPDLLFVVSLLASKVDNTSRDDYEALKRVLDYISCTKDECLQLCGKGDLKFVVYADASHGLHKEMRGHTGIIMQLCGSTVYASSKKQKLNSLSSTESENKPNRSIL
jgi:hypothetical protein